MLSFCNLRENDAPVKKTNKLFDVASFVQEDRNSYAKLLDLNP